MPKTNDYCANSKFFLSISTKKLLYYLDSWMNCQSIQNSQISMDFNNNS